jgi:hypothetical protein
MNLPLPTLLALLLWVSFPPLARCDLPVTVVNYSNLPVHATAVPLDHHLLCRKPGVPDGTPLRARADDGKTSVPLACGSENGMPTVRLFVSLPARTRLQLAIEAASAWENSPPVEAKPDLIRNGVVRVSFAPEGWELAFDAGPATNMALIRDGQLDFWIDDQNRGRISMESPSTGCGVGLSTLLPTPGKVGQGSMIWGCGAYGFQCNFIDPVRGQFPFRIEARGTLENGFAFLATQTGTSVFRQTAELWQALQAAKLPRLAPPCAVFVGDEAVAAQTIARLDDCSDRRIAVRLDFNKHFECRLKAATKVLARPLAKGIKPVVLLDSGTPADQVLDLNQRLGWADEVPFVLESAPGRESWPGRGRRPMRSRSTTSTRPGP